MTQRLSCISQFLLIYIAHVFTDSMFTTKPNRCIMNLHQSHRNSSSARHGMTVQNVIIFLRQSIGHVAAITFYVNVNILVS